MKLAKLGLALLIASTSITSFAGNYTCKRAIQNDTIYHTPIVEAGSFWGNLADIGADCFRRNPKYAADGTERVFTCMVTSLGVILPIWAVGAGPILAPIGLIGLTEFADHEYKHSSRQFKLNTIIHDVYTKNELNQQQINYLDRKFFAGYEMTASQMSEFFERNRNNTSLCDNEPQYKNTYKLDEAGMAYINSLGYPTAMSFLLDPYLPDGVLQYVERNFLVTNTQVYGQAITQRQMKRFVDQEMDAMGIRKIRGSVLHRH